MRNLGWKARYVLSFLFFMLIWGCSQQLPNKVEKDADKQAGKAVEQQGGDWYRTADIIGTLGGRKVKMSFFKIQDISYTDTPSAFSRKWEEYKAPPRTYDSELMGFGFYLNYEKGVTRDIRRDAGFYDELKVSGKPWVLVGVETDLLPGEKGQETFHRLLSLRLEEDNEPFERYVRQADKPYGLELYQVLGNDPRTGKPYREESSFSDDLFIARDQEGKIVSYIHCAGNTDVPNPPCDHDFVLNKDGMHIRFDMVYSRHRLYDWRRIEAEAVKIVEGFVAAAEADIAAGNGNRVWMADEVPEGDSSNSITGVDE